jgi:hypothetical protein
LPAAPAATRSDSGEKTGLQWTARTHPIAASAVSPAISAPGTVATRDPQSVRPDAPAQTLQPVLEVNDDVTLVRLPFEGDLERMQARLWGEPFALAVDLPHGRVKLAAGSYPLHAGSAAELRVQRRSGAELIRLTLAAPLARYAVAVQNGTLELRLVRHPAVAPSF